MHEHALENLRFIRSTMERAGSFTAVPGIGMILMGLTAFPAALAAWGQMSARGWLRVWLAEMVVAFLIGAVAMVRKARRSGAELWSEPGRKFAMSFAPALLAGALLTPALVNAGLRQITAASWLLLYGVAVMGGGAFSARVVPVMGGCFVAMGALALWAPPGFADFLLALGFGGLHVVFGFWIWRNHGG